MGVPVAKTQGMKTGVAGDSDLEEMSTGNGTPFSSTKPLWRRASPREGSPLSAISAHLSRSLPQDRQRACRRACHAEATSPPQIRASDQSRRRHRQRSATTQSRTASARGLRREPGLLSFRTWLATYKDAMCNKRHKHDGMHDCVEGSRAHGDREGHNAHPSHAQSMKHQAAARSLSACG